MDSANYRKRPPTPTEQIADAPLFAMAAEPDGSPNPAWLVAPSDDLEKAFRSFHELNPEVYASIEASALAAHRAGVTRIGIAKIVEDIRYRGDMPTAGGVFRINNNHRALYARLLVFRHPELESVLATRARHEPAAP